MLIILLNHESLDVQTSAAQALAVMAENLTSRDSIREWGMYNKFKISNTLLCNNLLGISTMNIHNSI